LPESFSTAFLRGALVRFGLAGASEGFVVISSLTAVFLVVFFTGAFVLAGDFWVVLLAAGLASSGAFADSESFAFGLAVLVCRVFGLGFFSTVFSFISVAVDPLFSADAVSLAAGFLRGRLAGAFFMTSSLSTSAFFSSLFSAADSVFVTLAFA
jgi:hypothetical protein